MTGRAIDPVVAAAGERSNNRSGNRLVNESLHPNEQRPLWHDGASNDCARHRRVAKAVLRSASAAKVTSTAGAVKAFWRAEKPSRQQAARDTMRKKGNVLSARSLLIKIVES
jgi:hypothetical protein